MSINKTQVLSVASVDAMAATETTAAIATITISGVVAKLPLGIDCYKESRVQALNLVS